MFGLVGLAECVNTLMQKEGKEGRFGHSEEADALGLSIIQKIDEHVKAHHNAYCPASGYHFLMHGQVGIETDLGESPATRIPIGDEPAEVTDHLCQCAQFHGYFPSGVGEVIALEPTVHSNPDYLLDLVRGGFQKGGRYFSLYAGDSDVIRVTGYLVKRSEMEKLDQGKSVLHDTTALGLGAAKNGHILERKRR